SRLCCGTTCDADTTFSSAAGAGKSCCSDSDCNGTGAPNCDGHACSTCWSVTLDGTTHSYNFVVDPANTSDTGTSGIASPTSCRFRTLTHALQYVATFNGITSSTPARIAIYADISPTTGEAFPLVLPANVEVLGQPQSGTTPPKVLVPAGKVAFRLGSSNSGLSNLTIDGVDDSNSSTRYTSGVVIDAPPGGSAPTGITLDHVSVQQSLRDGIAIGAGNATTGATVTVGPGVRVSGAGFGSAGGAGGTVRSNGITIAGSASVTIVGGAGSDRSAFNENSQHGIAVHDRAAITIAESLNLTDPTSMAYDEANVTANGNDFAGLTIIQSPVGAATNSSDWQSMPTNMITGLVTLNTRNGNGIRLEGGSKVVLRSCVSYGNAANGVAVPTSTASGGSAADANFVGGIDLGASGHSGGNVVQVPGVAFGATPPHGQSPNQGAGICLNIAAAASGGQTLAAQGNWLVASGSNAETDCSSSAGTAVVRRDTNCRSTQSTGRRLGIPTSVGIIGPGGGMNTNAVDVTQCQ
ncbi:MAG: hypothetical protein ACHQDE_07750, partial [Acidimicrobiia bacterium]